MNSSPGSHRSRASRSSSSSKPLNEDLPRRVRRLAAISRPRRPSGNDHPPDGLDLDQERELLALASREFDVFVTVDRNLSHRQNLDLLPIAVIVLSALTNRLADLRPLAPQLLAAIASIAPGRATIVSAGSPPLEGAPCVP